MILLFKMASKLNYTSIKKRKRKKSPLKHSAEKLSSVLKPKKVEMCLTEKTDVLDKLQSGMSYIAVGYACNVNESII